jgi:hypothetical protein
MHSAPIAAVISAVQSKFGADAFSYYGSSWAEVHGVAFTVGRIPATFSVVTQDGTLPDGRYEVQIEGVPPGDYIFTDTVSLKALLELVEQMSKPPHEWPRGQ